MKPTLLVLAAGMGSRYGGVKQIDAFGAHGETLLDFGVYDAKQAGYGKVVFIIRKDIEKDFRERLFDRIARNMDAEYVFQDHDSLLTPEQIELSKDRTKPWGTIHALLCAKEKIMDAPFTVINSDDYYGRSAYEILGKYQSTLDINDPKHAMVAFKLKNTMSPEGSVSRGICSIENGMLTKMVENTKIEYDGKGGIISHMPDGDYMLDGDTNVSMNFFGFTPKALDTFVPYWEKFIAENCTTPKNECFLPNAASEIVTSGAGELKVFESTDKWFGVTYQSDRENVMRELAEKFRTGYYPEQLWEK